VPDGAYWGSSGGPVSSLPGDLNQAKANLAMGRKLEGQQQEACADFFYRAAMQAWDALERTSCPSAVNPDYHAAWQTYQQSLARLIPAASRFGRLDPRAHLTVNGLHGRRAVPITYYGFAWRPSDFCQVVPASEFLGRDLQHHYRAPGFGTSLVAVRYARCEEPFFRTTQPFAVTAVLRPVRRILQSQDGSDVAIHACEPEAALDFYNPYLFDSLPLGSAVVRLERDLSAPFVYGAQETPRNYLQGFLDPGETDVQPKLFMMEPYQRGKIPVVFIHGLLSDPITWLDAVNELRVHPDLYQRYQFWYYRYPTGGGVLESAAKLREQLLLARKRFDPAGQDEAMARVVLIGHSMGGLVARLQVTYSFDVLWRHAARQPLEAVVTTPDMRGRLERDFFFDPSPLVSRVVFIGTPHRGATMARRLVGQFASSLVRPFGSEEPKYRQLMDQNPDVFYAWCPFAIALLAGGWHNSPDRS
jgi:pimeloyl-ACP methyl ester carboxylesterase